MRNEKMAKDKAKRADRELCTEAGCVGSLLRRRTITFLILHFSFLICLVCLSCTPFEGDIETIRDKAGLSKFTVTFNANGGTPEPAQQIVKKNNKATEPQNVTKTGYTLTGWYTDNNTFNKQWNFAKNTVTKDITLHAKWNPITYTISYNKNADGAAGTTANSAHTYDVESNLAPNGFTRTGYTFTGWARTSTGEVEFDNGQIIPPPNLAETEGAIIELYAKWSDKAYTVVYNANDGYGNMTNSVFLIDVPENLRANIFIRTG